MHINQKDAVSILHFIAGILFTLGLIGVMGIAGNESLALSRVVLYSVPCLLMMWVGSVLASWR